MSTANAKPSDTPVYEFSMIQFPIAWTSSAMHPGCRLHLARRVLITMAIASGIVLIAQGFCATQVHAASQDRPNVVLILADDLGWSDTTLFGTTRLYRTPNIERLARRGMVFERAYSSSPLCSPTRASILTGLSPARTGITSPTCHLPEVRLKAESTPTAAPNQKSTTPKSVTRLDTRYRTLAETLSDNGYATGHFGKWHLGPAPYSPLQHGFDVDVPHWAGPGPAGSYVAPWKFPDFDPQTPDEHIEDRMAREAVAFIESHRSEPFFLNYWMFSVHAPFDAKRALIDAYRKDIDPNDAQRSPTYAAMIQSMDDAVGTLLDTLDRLKIADNTIIVFASDNGGNMYNQVDGTTPTSNRPLRGGKATMYEGGVRGPAIVAVPGLVKPGTRSDAVIQSCDYYPTLLELLNIPAQANQVFDGISIVAALRGERLDREAIFTYFPHAPGVPDWLPPSVSVHHGPWKLIRIFYGGDHDRSADRFQHRYKLFHLDDDIGETKDLAQQEPQRVKTLDALIDQFLHDTGAAVPLPNPQFDPARYDPSREGIATLKGAAADKRPKTKTNANRPAAKPVAGWHPEGDARLRVTGGAMEIKSTGSDPHMHFPLDRPLPPGRLKVVLTMTSDSSGDGQIFWHEQGVKPAYFRDRSEMFVVHHDGQEHRYEISIDAHQPVVGLRIDPSRAAGTILIKQIQLLAADGKPLQQWTF